MNLGTVPFGLTLNLFSFPSPRGDSQEWMWIGFVWTYFFSVPRPFTSSLILCITSEDVCLFSLYSEYSIFSFPILTLLSGYVEVASHGNY